MRLRETVRAADLLPAHDEVQVRAGNLLLASGQLPGCPNPGGTGAQSNA